MIEIFDIMLLRPGWLLTLPLVGVIGYFFVPRVTALAGWDRAIDPALLAALERLGRVVPGSGRRNWFPAATAMLIACALIGPANEVREEDELSQPRRSGYRHGSLAVGDGKRTIG